MTPFVEDWVSFLVGLFVGGAGMFMLGCVLIFAGNCAEHEDPPQIGPPRLPR